MCIQILELNNENLKEYEIKDFLFKMIKDSYNLDYVPEYHYDIVNIEDYYLKPLKNNFLIAIETKKDELVGTIGIRQYDRILPVKYRDYNKETTASLYRLFVDPQYRHCKIATKMLKNIEKFSKDYNYSQIYLHTHENSYGALPFWLKNHYNIIYKTDDEFGTVHMEKIL